MGFPQNVADEVFVKCRRHCCLCGKYAGQKMELHHIKQVADGGDNSVDNCIPLCFDCHADVASYNPRHPKGRKYTEMELKQCRDNYYREFSNNISKNHINILNEHRTATPEPVFHNHSDLFGFIHSRQISNVQWAVDLLDFELIDTSDVPWDFANKGLYAYLNSAISYTQAMGNQMDSDFLKGFLLAIILIRMLCNNPTNKTYIDKVVSSIDFDLFDYYLKLEQIRFGNQEIKSYDGLYAITMSLSTAEHEAGRHRKGYMWAAAYLMIAILESILLQENRTM